ncbi:MAG: ribonuclease E activity regulator RraA [Pirellulales bacterium]|nr:ribonuclease E activity regulator RraA [Pirellulales bacterium]
MSATPGHHFATADLSDEFGDEVQVAAPLLVDFGGRRRFCGLVATVRCPEDNSLVRAALETPGAGRVLVVDGLGSRRVALLGDQLGELAVRNGWSGVVVYGCVRDTAALAQLDLGVKALAAQPRKSLKRNHGDREVTVSFAGVTIAPGAWLYADEDGILVAPRPLIG